MDQNEAPLIEALAEYHRLDRYGFTPPGHRQGRGADPRVREVLGASTFRSDVLVSGGLDDRTSSGGYLKKAEQLMAEAVGAEQAFFSTCGSSLSVKAAVLAVAAGKGDLLVSRDAHKSIVAGLVFSGIQPRWIRPRWDPKLHLAHPPSPADVEAMWERYPDAAGVLIVSPTPYGTCADIAAIAKICHDRGKPLIVDEAWGAHLPFHKELPTWAMNAGADICVVSVHKMGAGFEQGSVYHLQGDLVDPAHLSACADLLMTTSPNAILYSAIDGWRRQMVQHGTELLGNALHRARKLRRDIDQLPGIQVLEDELLAAESSTTWTACRSSWTCQHWASAATRPPTGCGNTAGSTSASATTAGSWRRCPWPTTTHQPGVCWMGWRPSSRRPRQCPLHRRWHCPHHPSWNLKQWPCRGTPSSARQRMSRGGMR
ncbi:aminotransferase class I/II-fold pyridoxal phosphate-dependent enzyme [Arthrobacter sp. ok362]|uniref:aminotransferase class I/II-fold pyridoxal phosphate-dependent enzyme n=1 Tax=Arthrobacter sp. ok362 TaxID=1761745 RepID=UPI00087EB1D2|nr:hypothetical protein [Arthrobacter sp. ok362]SDK60539.1 Orn/Lys/Arg decarboxylase, major domain [Arthrobacter sp. ok362]